ncbi:hypothetical protein BKA70DRAFT_1084981, partial [Coprinopsis sp. MPI-PUGE-AT-0042]
VRTHIGAHKEVEVDSYICDDAEIQRRQTNETNVCGANCDDASHCFTPSGGGPNPNDCNVIADALRYESQNTAVLFSVGTSTNVTMRYNTCRTFFKNQNLAPLIYCRTEWAALTDYLSLNCQATQNAHGGLCLAANQAWFVQ